MKDLKRNNIILLVCLVALIFLAPVSRDTTSLVGDLLLTAIFFSGIFSLDFSTKSLKILLPLGTATAATTWIGHFTALKIVYVVDSVSTLFFLVTIVVLMTGHIARSRNVTPTIILSSINGYLLLGVLGSVLLALTDRLQRGLGALGDAGINFPGNHLPEFHDYMYFSLVTLTTLGYGDVTPASHFSRSMAVLIAISGQMYMTILIALLVGKFLARAKGS